MSESITQPGPIYVFANYKGGVAKTESAYRIGIQFARAGLLPWLIDLDPQANLTRRCGGTINGQKTISDVLGGAVPPTANINQAAHRIEPGGHSGFLVASNMMLENVALGLLQRNFGRLTALATALTECRQFIGTSPVLIDTPPNAGVLTLNALVAATHLVICADPEEDAITGVRRIVEIVGQIQKDLGRAPKIVGVIATRVDSQTNRHQAGLAALRALDMPMLGEVPKRGGVDADAQLDAALTHR
jgi:chromosome partitioning protein